MLEDAAHKVRIDGWAELYSDENVRAKILDVGRFLGTPIRVGKRFLDVLTPKLAKSTRANSLSGRHGLSEFPLHTDFAHWTTPPRFIILACETSGSEDAPTRFARADWTSLAPEELDLCISASFVIRNGRNSFYSSAIDPDQGYLRYDRACMWPTDERASNADKVLSKLLTNITQQECRWKRGKILILDNWKVVHGRAAIIPASDKSEERTLLRICVQ